MTVCKAILSLSYVLMILTFFVSQAFYVLLALFQLMLTSFQNIQKTCFLAEKTYQLAKMVH